LKPPRLMNEPECLGVPSELDQFPHEKTIEHDPPTVTRVKPPPPVRSRPLYRSDFESLGCGHLRNSGPECGKQTPNDEHSQRVAGRYVSSHPTSPCGRY